MIKQEERNFFKTLGHKVFSKKTSIEVKPGEIRKETVVGLCVREIITQSNFPLITLRRQSRSVGENARRPVTFTLTPVLTIQKGPDVSFAEYETGKGVLMLEEWG